MTDRPNEPYTSPPSPDDAETISGAGPPITDAPEPVASSLIGTKIGGFSLKRIIGSGGMGTVYEAMQEQPRRRVAVKMMKRGITSKSALRRFEFESQLLGRLRHPGIAQVYEAGTHDDGSGGVPYFAMEYISSARSLTQYVQEKKFSTRERLVLFAKVCDAVQHGHLKGIVHRDLKPDNILVDSSGQPKIIDFGVARSTDSDLAVTTLQTDVGQLVGTLQYMSPEQVEADPSDIDARSDVYALGVVLYELLTGNPPYDVRQAAIHEAVRMVREEEPTKLSTIDRHLRGDIETIAIKALEKDRDHRYQSATAMQEDIGHYLADEPIAAKPPSAFDYLKRFTRKHKAAAVFIAAIFMVLVGAVIGISAYAVEADRQADRAEIDNIRFHALKNYVHELLAPNQSVFGSYTVFIKLELALGQPIQPIKDRDHWIWLLSHAGDSFDFTHNGVSTRRIDEIDLRRSIGFSYYLVGLNDQAITQWTEALALARSGEDLLTESGFDRPGDASLYKQQIRRELCNNLGAALALQGRYDEAEPCFVEAIALLRGLDSDYGKSEMQDAITQIIILYELWGKPEEAQKYREMLPAKEKASS